MRSQLRTELARVLRSGLDEFAHRWVKYIKANDLAPDTDEPEEEAVNRARLGFEVFANLLEGGDFTKFENVIRRILYDWINRAASFSDVLALEDAFPLFMLPYLHLEEESDEAGEFIFAVDDFFHSDLRSHVLALYLSVFEEIIGAESHHTAYILSHFEAILDLTAHLNAAESREEILSILTEPMRGLFENVIAVAIWSDTSEGLSIRTVEVMDETVPPAVLDEKIPDKFEEIFNIGDARWIPGDDLPADLKSLIGGGKKSTLSGCAIPVRPREAAGLLILLMTGSEHPGMIELSLSRVASSECALALDRVNGRERISNVNRRIRDILSLSRETSWGSSCRETGYLVLDYLLDLSGGNRAILLATPASETGKASPAPLAWRDITEDEVNIYRKTSKLPPIIAVPIRSGKPVLLTSDRLSEVLSGREPPPGFAPLESQALGILPLVMSENFHGVCLFLCPKEFAGEPESSDLLAVFAKTAADSLATAREFERSVRIESIAEADANRARALQRQLTPRYARSGNLVYWAHLQPAGELAGDVLVVKNPADGCLQFWGADVAGRGTAVAWSMIFIRQLLAEIPQDIEHTSDALALINQRLHDIESMTSPGIFATLTGLLLTQSNETGKFTRAGSPGLHRIVSDGTIESINPDGLPLGLFDDAQLEEREFSFKPGDKLVWASDGLLGIRNESGRSWGEAGLLACISGASFLPARALFEKTLASLGDFSADDMARDDWSLVVIGHDAPPDWIKKMPGRDREQLISDSLSWLDAENFGINDYNAIRLLLDEAIRNAHEHGNQLDEAALIEVKLRISPRHVHIQVRDEGGKLNERVTSRHLRPDKILEDKGRGFLLMRHQADHLWVEDDRGELNAVRILEEKV